MEHITLVVEEGRGRHRSERSQGPRGSLGSIGHLTAALKGSLPTWRSLRWGSPPISQPHRRGRMPSTHGTRVPLATHFPLQAPAACTVFRDSVCLRVGWETFRSVGEVTPQNLNFFFGCVCVCVFERSDSRVALFPPPLPSNERRYLTGGRRAATTPSTGSHAIHLCIHRSKYEYIYGRTGCVHYRARKEMQSLSHAPPPVENTVREA